MGLRESLRDFFTMQDATAAAKQATGKFAADTEALSQKQDLRALASQIPGALQSGDLSSVAGQAYGLGDPSILKMAIEGNMKAAKGGDDTPLTYQQLLDLGADPQQAAVIATTPSRDRQRQELTAAGSIASRKEQAIDRDQDRSIRSESQHELSRNRFVEGVEKNLKPYRKNMEEIEKLGDVFDLQDRSQWWLAATKILKTIGGEAGALTDSDLNRPFANTAWRNIQDLSTWMGAKSADANNLDPKTVQSIQNLVESAKAFNEKKLKERAQIEIKKRAEVGGGRLRDKDGNPSALLQDVAGEYGFVAAKGKNGLEVGDSVETGKRKPDIDLKGSADAMEMIRKIPAGQQAFAVKKLEEFSKAGKPPSPAFLQKLKELSGSK
jgi:hypothetical protein